MGGLWVLPFMLGGFMILQLVVALLETRQIEAYGPGLIDDEPVFGKYLSGVDECAEVLGLVERSVHHHLRFRVVALMWFTPERDVLVLSGEGRVARMRVRQTWLYSRLQNGRIFMTSDNFDEGDVSGQVKSRRVIGARLDKLLAKHCESLEHQMCGVEPFLELTCAEALSNMKRGLTEELIGRGLAKWTEQVEGKWRYTFLGAFLGWGSFFRQLWAGLLQFWRVVFRF